LADVLLDKLVTLHVRQKNRPRTVAEVERLIKLHIKPMSSGRKVGDVSKRDVRGIGARRTPDCCESNALYRPKTLQLAMPAMASHGGTGR
jgi:hypothetical protein